MTCGQCTVHMYNYMWVHVQLYVSTCTTICEYMYIYMWVHVHLYVSTCTTICEYIHYGSTCSCTSNSIIIYTCIDFDAVFTNEARSYRCQETMPICNYIQHCILYFYTTVYVCTCTCRICPGFEAVILPCWQKWCWVGWGLGGGYFCTLPWKWHVKGLHCTCDMYTVQVCVHVHVHTF